MTVADYDRILLRKPATTFEHWECFARIEREEGKERILALSCPLLQCSCCVLFSVLCVKRGWGSQRRAQHSRRSVWIQADLASEQTRERTCSAQQAA